MQLFLPLHFYYFNSSCFDILHIYAPLCFSMTILNYSLWILEQIIDFFLKKIYRVIVMEYIETKLIEYINAIR